MCFLCFFKQKAAYEMRISDGISDVGSSDLSKLGQPRYAVLDFDAALIHGQGRASLHLDRARCYGEIKNCARAVADCDQALRLAPDCARILAEIGRASCRERGCQYV